RQARPAAGRRAARSEAAWGTLAMAAPAAEPPEDRTRVGARNRRRRVTRPAPARRIGARIARPGAGRYPRPAPGSMEERDERVGTHRGLDLARHGARLAGGRLRARRRELGLFGAVAA